MISFETMLNSARRRLLAKQSAFLAVRLNSPAVQHRNGGHVASSHGGNPLFSKINQSFTYYCYHIFDYILTRRPIASNLQGGVQPIDQRS